MRNQTYRAFDQEINSGNRALATGQWETAVYHFERAHILGQRHLLTHVQTHWGLLRIALARKNNRELPAQLLRLLTSVPESLFGLAPKGNTGGSNMGLFQKKPIPEDLLDKM